jgi:ParB-like chromosome segregation protein Spo0J
MSTNSNTPKIVSMALDEIKPYDNNVKKHDDDQVKTIAASIRKFGVDQPIVVDGDNVIIKGHGRLLAAKSLGMTHFPVIVRLDLSPEEANAARIIDNRVARTDDDVEKLKVEMDRILGSGEFEMSDMLDLGFTEKELNFSLEEFEDLNVSSTIENLEEATESQMSKTDDLLKEIRVKPVNIHQVFGFKHVPGEYAKAISDFIAMIEASGTVDGPTALGKFAEQYVRTNAR